MTSEPHELDPTAYLRDWSEAELIERALRVINDAEFSAASYGCATFDQMREHLGVNPDLVDSQRQERKRAEREAERRRRTIDIAGAPFEVGTTSYSDLFDRLNKLGGLTGPRASEDALTPLANVRPSDSRFSEDGINQINLSDRRASVMQRDVVGVVGEIHAYHFLRAEFGSDVVTRDAWVSENRLKVLPLVQGERDATSDAHGFDFRFRHGSKVWKVEVKATQGDDTQFDLGISEIDAASRLARTRDECWRILRVVNALSEQPKFEWLPNPFEEEFRKLFRLRKGGMIVSYARSN